MLVIVSTVTARIDFIFLQALSTDKLCSCASIPMCVCAFSLLNKKYLLTVLIIGSHESDNFLVLGGEGEGNGKYRLLHFHMDDSLSAQERGRALLIRL